MRCPYCHHLETQVIDSRLINDSHSVRRRRRCMACDRRFNTYETAEIRMPQVIKSSVSACLLTKTNYAPA